MVGGSKLHYMYRDRFGADYEYMVGRDKMEDIIAKHHLNVRLPRRRPRTTDSTHGLPTYPNLVKDIIPSLGDGHYLYPYMESRRQLYLLLSVDDYRLLYKGNHQLVCRRDDGGVVQRRMSYAGNRNVRSK